MKSMKSTFLKLFTLNEIRSTVGTEHGKFCKIFSIFFLRDFVRSSSFWLSEKWFCFAGSPFSRH